MARQVCQSLYCSERVRESGTFSAGIDVALKDIYQDIKQRSLAERGSYIREEPYEDLSYSGEHVIDIV